MNPASQRAGNVFRTGILLAGLTALLLAIGYLFGGSTGLILFAGIAILFNLAMYWFSGSIALKMSHAQEVAEDEEPELHRMIANLADRAEVPKPRVYDTPADQPNAFATGRSPKHAAIAVTQGIQRVLPMRELEGVLAHEMAHIKNRDILIASIAAMIAGAIAAVANILQFGLIFGDNRDNPLGILGTLATVIIAPLAAMIIQMAISRQREYVADASGAEILGDPLPLADALETLQRGASAVPMEVNQATASLYIVNPLSALHGRGMANIFSTHPPTEERVARLREMAGVSDLRIRTF